MDAAEPILLGALSGSYGVKGWIKVRPFQDGSALLKTHIWLYRSADGELRPLAIEQSKRHGQNIIAKIEGVETPEAAQALKGAVCLKREDFPQTQSGEFYWVDLIGCIVINQQGEEIGRVESMDTNGVQDILVVRGKASEYLIPFVSAYILKVDVAQKSITADWDVSWV
jgi:16S rRNA processing protein RimM